MTVPLYDDQHTTQSTHSHSASGGDVHTMTGGQQDGGQPDDSQPGGLDGASSASGQNPVEKFLTSSSWTREDLDLLLSFLSIVAWVGLTLYLANN
jgi:hypothetical protein